MKVKATKNKANQIETRQESIEDKSSEELGLILNEQHNLLTRTTNNIQVINQLLERRIKEKLCQKPETTSETGKT